MLKSKKVVKKTKASKAQKEKRVVSKKEQFKKYLERVEDPNYQGSNTSWALPKNATLLEKVKYELCKQMLIYQQDHNLSDEQIAKKIHLTVGETRDILYYHIDYFTLDRLIAYAARLLKPLEIKKNPAELKINDSVQTNLESKIEQKQTKLLPKNIHNHDRK